MHVSLDGFTAGTDGKMEWINVGEEMFGYAEERTKESDMALYGRVTYQLMDSYWPTAADNPDATPHDIQHSKWYNKVAKVVVSKTMKGPAPANTTIIGSDLKEEIGKLKAGSGKNIIMFGSPGVASTLIQENLIDEYWLLVNPIVLGNGIPLFGHSGGRINLQLLSANTFRSGVVCLHYQTKRYR